jgi:hypothetical protein
MERKKVIDGRWPESSPRVVAVRPANGYRLELTFDDGAVGVVDFEGWLIGTAGGP